MFAKAVRLRAVEHQVLKNQIAEAVAALMDVLKIPREEATRQIDVLRASLFENSRGTSSPGFVRFDKHGDVVWEPHRES